MRRVVFSSSGDLTRHPADQVHRRSSRFAFAARAAANSISTVLFPADCRICSLPLSHISRVPVCESCLESAQRIEGRVCRVCSERLFTPEGDEDVCGQCVRQHPSFERAVAYGSHDGALRELIHLLKYEGMRPVARLLGRMLAEAIRDLSPHFGTDAPIIVPVPLHAGKGRMRGFNQAELIARMALKSGVLGSLQVRTGVLARTRATESQTGLTRAQRRQNMRGAFAVQDPNVVKGCDILLVDDVFTTGTTVSECARMLRKAGAARVFVATVARVLRSEAGFTVGDFDAPGVMLAAGAQV